VAVLERNSRPESSGLGGRFERNTQFEPFLILHTKRGQVFILDRFGISFHKGVPAGECVVCWLDAKSREDVKDE